MVIMAQSNVIDFSTSSNAMIQDISEGLMRKKCGSRNTGEKKTAWSYVSMGIWLEMENLNNHTCANINNKEIDLDQWHM